MKALFEAVFFSNDTDSNSKEKTVVIFDPEIREKVREFLKKKYPIIGVDKELYNKIAEVNYEEFDKVIMFTKPQEVLKDIGNYRRISDKCGLCLVFEEPPVGSLRKAISGFSDVEIL